MSEPLGPTKPNAPDCTESAKAPFQDSEKLKIQRNSRSNECSRAEKAKAQAVAQPEQGIAKYQTTRTKIRTNNIPTGITLFLTFPA